MAKRSKSDIGHGAPGREDSKGGANSIAQGDDGYMTGRLHVICLSHASSVEDFHQIFALLPRCNTLSAWVFSPKLCAVTTIIGRTA
jgi:hypothetical protein